MKTVLLLGGLSALLVLIGGAVSPGLLYVFVGIAVVMNLASYFYSDKLVLAMNRAHPISEGDDPRLHGIVAELADARRGYHHGPASPAQRARAARGHRP